MEKRRFDGSEFIPSEVQEKDVERNPDLFPEYIDQEMKKVAGGESVWLRVKFNWDDGKLYHYFFKGSHCGYLIHLYGKGSQIWGTGFGEDHDVQELSRRNSLEEDVEVDIKIAMNRLEMNALRRWELASQNRVFRDVPVSLADAAEVDLG